MLEQIVVGGAAGAFVWLVVTFFAAREWQREAESAVPAEQTLEALEDAVSFTSLALYATMGALIAVAAA